MSDIFAELSREAIDNVRLPDRRPVIIPRHTHNWREAAQQYLAGHSAYATRDMFAGWIADQVARDITQVDPAVVWVYRAVSRLIDVREIVRQERLADEAAELGIIPGAHICVDGRQGTVTKTSGCFVYFDDGTYAFLFASSKVEIA